MQIHELTKRRKQVDEGILDGVKAAVNVAKTGADKFASAMIPGYDTAKAGVQAVKTGYNTVDPKTGKKGGLAGAAKASVSGSALTQAQGQLARGQLADDPRIVRGKTIQQVLAAVSKDPDIKASAQKLIPAFQQQFIPPQPDIEYAPTDKGKAELDKRRTTPAPVEPPPGKMLPGTKTNKSQELVKKQNRQMSSASGLEEAQVNTNKLATMKARTKNSTPAAVAGAKTPSDSGSKIEAWVAKKINGFTPKVSADQEAKTILSKPLQDIQKVVTARTVQALPQALTNYLLAAKAATMYVNQKELEKKSKPSRAGDFVDNDGDGEDDNAADLGYQSSSPAARQVAINNLRDLGIDTAALAPLVKAVRQGGAKDVKAALGLQEQLQQELKKFKNTK